MLRAPAAAAAAAALDGTRARASCVAMGSSADCTGGMCHAECEQRHLDSIEVTRDERWSWPEKPKVIICAGPERSGSTWLYNAVRLLYRQASTPCDSYWVRTLSEDKVQKRLEQGAHVCIKMHVWEPEYERWLPAAAQHILLTHRDLRGVVASYRRAGWCYQLDPKYVDDHMQWRRICSMDLGYEDLVRDGLASLKALALHIGVELPPAGLEKVHEALKDLKNERGGGVDQITKLWPGHISSATRMLQDQGGASIAELNSLSDERYCQQLRQRFPGFFSTYGYE